MTEIEKISMVRVLTGEADTDMISAYLVIAGKKVCNRAYPFNPTVMAVPNQYALIQVQIAVYLLNKRGAEGQTSHSENGISRAYEDGDVPPTLLRDIVPCAAVIGG